MKIVGELEQMVSEDVPLDHRVHARIIGARGKAIRKIMDEFKVSPQAEPGVRLTLRAGGGMGCTPQTSGETRGSGDEVLWAHSGDC